MRLSAAVLLGGCLVLGVAPQAAAGDSMRCSGHLLQQGDPAVEVRHYCGPPTFIDPWNAGAGAGYGLGFSMQAWTYNRGPSRLIQILIFKNGKVDSVENAGYGFRPGQGSRDCSRGGIVNGMSKYELLAACGDPAQRSAGFVYSSRFSAGARDYYLNQGVFPVYRETWIYNFGPSRLLHEITLENGRVVNDKTLGRGFRSGQ